MPILAPRHLQGERLRLIGVDLGRWGRGRRWLYCRAHLHRRAVERCSGLPERSLPVFSIRPDRALVQGSDRAGQMLATRTAGVTS